MADEWLKELVVGDRVIIPGNWSCAGKIVTIERVTKTLLVTENGVKWRKYDGSPVGSYRGSHLQEATDGNKRVLFRERLHHWFGDIARKLESDYDPPIKLSYDALEAIRAVIQKEIAIHLKDHPGVADLK